MDLEFTISGQQWIGVAIGAVLYMVLSMIWYMPKVFGNRWMAGEGLTEEDLQGAGTPIIYVITFVMALVSNVVIALILSNVGGGVVKRPRSRAASRDWYCRHGDCAALHVRQQEQLGLDPSRACRGSDNRFGRCDRCVNLKEPMRTNDRKVLAIDA